VRSPSETGEARETENKQGSKGNHDKKFSVKKTSLKISKYGAAELFI
jgi:hypothetical protein